MNKEKLIHAKLNKAVKDYQDFTNQFFTGYIDSAIMKKATKVLGCEDVRKIKGLQKEIEIVKNDLRDFLAEK